MFLEQQIRILEWFPRDHVTEVMAAKNSALQNSCFNSNIIDISMVYIAFLIKHDEHKWLLSKTLKNPNEPKMIFNHLIDMH